MTRERLRVLVLFGTRPEAVKLAPVVRRLAATPWIEQTVAVTGQHREMLDQVLDVFDIRPNVDLDLMRHGQSPAKLAAHTLDAVAHVVETARPDLLLVQGDTTSAFAGALAARYAGVPVGHVEAGLRSFDFADPFPEEINRRLISAVADLHFAPTARARRNLLAEGVPEAAITVTGNTVVDALRSIQENGRLDGLPPPPGVEPCARLILVTLHRRESWGERLAAMCGALRYVLERFPDTHILFPMHRNPVVRRVVTGVLDHPRAHLVEPLDYVRFVKAMSCCYLIATDSGGIQEEAPALGKPVLVLRETTERPEAIEVGTARLAGTAPERIVAAASELLADAAAYRAMAHAVSPFGDGRAAERIVAAIRAWMVRGGRLHDPPSDA